MTTPTHYNIVRTDSSHPDFQRLVRLLDAELAVLDGDEHAFYAQLNKTDNMRHCVVVYAGDVAVGSGAIREISAGIMEVKRMYADRNFRQRGVASAVLADLERWAAELGYHTCRLETGKRQPEAIALYTRRGYQSIPNYGKYVGMDNSVCFEKRIGPSLP